jgi:hypothetical protein
MRSKVQVGEVVALGLAHSAGRQPHGNDIVEHHHSAEDLPITRRLGKPEEIGCRIFEASLDLFLSLGRKLKELENR